MLIFKNVDLDDPNSVLKDELKLYLQNEVILDAIQKDLNKDNETEVKITLIKDYAGVDEAETDPRLVELIIDDNNNSGAGDKLADADVKVYDQIDELRAQPIDPEDKGDDYKVWLNDLGVYVEKYINDDGLDKVTVYIPDEVRTYDIKLVPTKAETVTETKTVKVGGTVPGTEWKVKEVKVPESVKTEEIVPLPVGQVGMLDTEVPQPWYKGEYEGLIVVGGPCINRVAAELLNKTYPACGAASGIPENAALVKVVEEGGKVAVLVAGWEAQDTRKAARMLAEYIAEGKNAEVFEGKEEVTISR